MGGFSKFDFKRPLAIPDTPPRELGSQSASSYSSRTFEDGFWKPAAPISPPMSHYDPSAKPDMSAGKSSEESQARRDASQSSSARQQLPSLSSIFGPPNQIRPMHSPLSDRPSPLYSPLDRPHSASANPDRSYPGSYFPPVSTPVTQPRSIYEPRLEQGRKALPMSGQQCHAPISPRTREFERNESVSSSRWSSQSSHTDLRRPEYIFGGREPAASFQTVNDRLPFAQTGYHSSHGANPDHRENEAHDRMTIELPTSSIVATTEGVPVRDGLGPKIWTGTQFLPRFLRQAEVPGEGLCYFYDDGTHCKTVIDGEQVNAHWGVTKAGKPRKRLAIACITCREKKIKCDPDYPRCVQCEKFGRICKFKNAPRGGHNASPVTSPREHDESKQVGAPVRPTEYRRPRSTSSTSTSPRTTTISHPSPDLPGMVSKRIRVEYDQYQHSLREPTHVYQASDPRKAENFSWQSRDLPRIHEDILCRAWQTDPYVSDPQATNNTITSFFNHIETTALRFLPSQQIKDWVKNSAHTKSPEDLMLLYSLLAFGIHVSGGPKSIAIEYAQVAKFACGRSNPCMQLVQSRLILSLFHLANSQGFDSYEMLSGAISAALCLGYNVEMDHRTYRSSTLLPYNMNQDTFAESRRRTMFSCFILEMTNGLFPSRPTLLDAEDIFLRLPCDENAFNREMEGTTETPNFDVTHPISQLGDEVGIMGYLVYVIEVWGRIISRFHREALGHVPKESDSSQGLVTERLRDCEELLPPKFRFSEPNLAQAKANGIEGCLVTLHLILLFARAKLNRHGQYDKIATSRPTSQVSQKNLNLAGNIMFVTSTVHGLLKSRRYTDAPFLPTPFIMYAAVEAVDILTGSGMVSMIPNSIRDTSIAKDLCDALIPTWRSAMTQKELLDRRTEKLLLIRERAEHAITNPIPGCEVYRAPDSPDLMYIIFEPIESRFALKNDNIYRLRPTTQIPHSAISA